MTEQQLYLIFQGLRDQAETPAELKKAKAKAYRNLPVNKEKKIANAGNNPRNNKKRNPIDNPKNSK
eukprot:1244326-Pyramimonas_sp.AAC.1